MTELAQTLARSLELLHLYRNNPEKVMNNACQVDPIIRATRMALERAAPGWSARTDEHGDYRVVLPKAGI